MLYFAGLSLSGSTDDFCLVGKVLVFLKHCSTPSHTISLLLLLGRAFLASLSLGSSPNSSISGTTCSNCRLSIMGPETMAVSLVSTCLQVKRWLGSRTNRPLMTSLVASLTIFSPLGRVYWAAFIFRKSSWGWTS